MEDGRWLDRGVFIATTPRGVNADSARAASRPECVGPASNLDRILTGRRADDKLRCPGSEPHRLAQPSSAGVPL